MLTLAAFLDETARKGEAVNLVFESRLFDLVGVLHKITNPLKAERIPYELVGGLAVLVHVEEADPTHSMMTRDVDLMIHRSDLEQVKAVAAHHGFRFRHAAGVDMLIYGQTDSAKNAVHLLFAGERVKASQATPNPPIAPEPKAIHGVEVQVIPVVDLVRMKLSSFRLKDQVHIQVMDAAGLITPEVVIGLLPDLQTRLQHVRESE